jgi:hypothetical protein
MGETINNLTIYESIQIELIEKWKKEEPGTVSKALGVALTPITWTIQKLVPQKAIQGVIDATNQVGQWLTDTKDIIRDGKVNTVEELRHRI